ncbi:hypothetical protein XENTR_v10007101 [Xenopus tropicalis]|nr:hypothetical protein XENTR_v10007101 [Xenopus tropicalis]
MSIGSFKLSYASPFTNCYTSEWHIYKLPFIDTNGITMGANKGKLGEVSESHNHWCNCQRYRGAIVPGPAPPWVPS